MKKKKILFQSDYSLAKTGFGRNAKAILSYLYKHLSNHYDNYHIRILISELYIFAIIEISKQILIILLPIILQ